MLKKTSADRATSSKIINLLQISNIQKFQILSELSIKQPNIMTASERIKLKENWDEESRRKCHPAQDNSDMYLGSILKAPI